MAEKFDNTNKGSLYKKATKDGTGSYLNGKVNVEGKEYWISVFKNSYKTEDKHPDYNVSITAIDAQSEVRQTKEDDPF